MFKKMTWILMLMGISLFAIACSSPAAEEAAVAEPAAETVADESMVEEAVVEEAMEEDAVVEETMEESMDEEMAESHDDSMDEADMAAEETEMEAESDMVDGSSEEMAEMTEEESATYVVNISDSNIRWEGSKPIGDPHFGSVAISEGSLVVENGALTGGNVTIDMMSITNEDLGGGMANRLVGHLMSEDFFAVDAFPTASINILSAEPAGDNLYNVEGEMTIKDVTQPISFVAEAVEEDGILTASADIVLDRTLFGVTYNSGSFFADLGDDLINDEMVIGVELIAAAS